jgi:flagellar L-ring protein precursor FlgH
MILRILLCGGVSLTAFSFLATTCRGQQTMWERRLSSQVFLFHDTKARQVGDLLTVVIRENTDVDNRDQRQMRKEVGGGGVFGLSGSTAGGGSSSVAADLESSSSYNREFDGRAQYSVARDFTDRMTVSVLDVLPNGNLVIGGKRSRLISGEERTLCVSGVVRPRDILPDNTVESPYISSFRVYYDGQGQESRFTNKWRLPSWVPRLRR